jgi:hypothetical protein
VVPHFPAFYVISSKSKFKEVFLKRHDWTWTTNS